MVTAVADPAVCVHRWIIDMPNGPSSIGRCRACGAQRPFGNSILEEKRYNNSDLFGKSQASARQGWSDNDVESALRSMPRS